MDREITSIKSLEVDEDIGQREPEPEKFWLPMPLDLDEDEKEILLKYWFAAETLGVNPECIDLQDAINGYPHRIEDAFLCLLEHKHRIEDGDHATNFLRKAFVLGWKPRKFQSFEEAKRAYQNLLSGRRVREESDTLVVRLP
ncbi:MAG: hypothetical protein PUP92_36895 [Rhizonema sp. PD38]|nr:hypothetical protein [Rhizonema sp. PD38]